MLELLLEYGATPCDIEKPPQPPQKEKPKKAEKIEKKQEMTSSIGSPTSEKKLVLGKRTSSTAGLVSEQEKEVQKKQVKPYVLTFLKDGQYVTLTQEELLDFEQKYPDIAKYWQDPETVCDLTIPEGKINPPRYEAWDRAAKHLLN